MGQSLHSLQLVSATHLSLTLFSMHFQGMLKKQILALDNFAHVTHSHCQLSVYGNVYRVTLETFWSHCAEVDFKLLMLGMYSSERSICIKIASVEGKT